MCARGLSLRELPELCHSSSRTRALCHPATTPEVGRRASAIAVSDVTVVPVSEKQFVYLVGETPYFALNVMRVLAQTKQPLVLIQDGARYHTSKAAQAFFAAQVERLTGFQLPSYSPDYNPMEKLWKKVKAQETHLHYFPTFESLPQRVEQALLKFAHAPQEILALCGLPGELAMVV